VPGLRPVPSISRRLAAEKISYLVTPRLYRRATPGRNLLPAPAKGAIKVDDAQDLVAL
jgi:hypothetical protein